MLCCNCTNGALWHGCRVLGSSGRDSACILNHTCFPRGLVAQKSEEMFIPIEGSIGFRLRREAPRWRAHVHVMVYGDSSRAWLWVRQACREDGGVCFVIALTVELLGYLGGGQWVPPRSPLRLYARKRRNLHVRDGPGR